MNKQEAIKELESYKFVGNDAKAVWFNEAIKVGILAIKQLDEPQKPVVPKFVADWFEDNKDDLEFAIWKLTIDSNSNYTKNKNEMRHWIQYAPNKPYKTLIGMLNGYEVEKEPLYCVKVGKGYFSGFDETKVTYVLDDAPGSLARRVTYKDKYEAEMDAAQIGGTVEEVAEE